MAVWNNAIETIINVKWTSGTWIVVNARRRAMMHGNSIPGVPDFTASSMLWHPQTAVQEISLNNPFFREGFPEEFRPKPSGTTGKFADLRSFRALTAWGGNEVQETGGGGPQLRRGGDFTTFAEGGGYQDGEWVRVLGFFNVPAIRKWPPYGPGPDGEGKLPDGYKPPANPEDIVFFLSINEIAAVPEPEPPGPQTVYYVWGQQLEFHPGFPNISGDVSFADKNSPTYYTKPFKIGEIADPGGGPNLPIEIPRVEAFLWYYSANWVGGGGSPPPPVQWPAPIQSQAQADAFVSWANQYANANPTGNAGTTLDARVGIVPAGGIDPGGVEQPEAYLELTVELYAGPTDFTYQADNTPMWTKEPAETYSFEWGGRAPQAGGIWKVTFKQNVTGNQKRLTVARTV